VVNELGQICIFFSCEFALHITADCSVESLDVMAGGCREKHFWNWSVGSGRCFFDQSISGSQLPVIVQKLS
jgi:hypothetical protein